MFNTPTANSKFAFVPYAVTPPKMEGVPVTLGIKYFDTSEDALKYWDEILLKWVGHDNLRNDNDTPHISLENTDRAKAKEVFEKVWNKDNLECHWVYLFEIGKIPTGNIVTTENEELLDSAGNEITSFRDGQV